MFCEFRVFRGKNQSPTELAEFTEPSAEIYSHGIQNSQKRRSECSVNSVCSVGKNNLPQNSQNSQNFLLRYTPTEFTETTIRMFCEFRVFRGKNNLPQNSRN